MTEHALHHKELAPQRLDRLRAQLRARRVVRVDELCEALEVSPATVRRDLEMLERQGELHRVHGGAVAAEDRVEEPVFDDKTALSQKEKARIAAHAAAFIEARDVIYLDGGSTVLELARLLRERSDITVVTNSLRAASELASGGPKLIVLGGELRRLSQTLVGPLTRHMLEELSIDKAFLGTLGLSLDRGITTTDAAEAYTKELVMSRARETFLLVDSTKAGKVAMSRAGRIEQIDTLISDKQLPDTLTRSLKKMGVNVIRT